jgi:predicted nucleic acid-binding protein
MTPKAQRITNYTFTSRDNLLLDANVWLLIYGPQKPRDRRVIVYSTAFADMLSAKSRIYIDVLIVSEFINAYARIKWRLDSSAFPDFKQFRKSNHFQSIAQDIAADMKQVLRHCTPIANGFESLAIDDLLTTYAAGNSDFNDQVLAALCQREGLKLVTDDADFGGQNISIITNNRNLLI